MEALSELDQNRSWLHLNNSLVNAQSQVSFDNAILPFNSCPKYLGVNGSTCVLQKSFDKIILEVEE